MTMPYGALGCRCWYWDQDAEGGDWGWEANPACPLHAPMTAEEAKAISEALADPDRPTRKLPPRPDRRCRLCESEWIGKFHPSGRAIAARSITEGKVTIPCEGHPERCPEHGIDDCVCSGPPDYTIAFADDCNHGPVLPDDDIVPVMLSPGAVACTWYGCGWEVSGTPESALMKLLLDHAIREHSALSPWTTEKRTGVFSAIKRRALRWLRGDR